MKLGNDAYKTILDNLNIAVAVLDTQGIITYWNKGAEAITGIKASEVIGRNCCSELIKHISDTGHDYCLDGCFIKHLIENRENYEGEFSFLLRGNTKLSAKVNITILYDENGEPEGAVEIFYDNSSKMLLERKNVKLMSINLIDPVTEVGNRRFAEINLKSRFNEWLRYHWQFGVLFIYIDNYNELMSKYGKISALKAKKLIATTLSNSFRPYDNISLWDETTFIVTLVNVNKETLTVVAERCRVLVEKLVFKINNDQYYLHVSIGAVLSRTKENIHKLRTRAQQLMEKGIASNGNTVIIEEE
ncbi:PAS/PAC sensor-containing diguanylate cyclase [Candidatus Magnetoovum chiemensis]|nr:PAS/PAC sensor-containing diguanylate cyclase [Candidatus Magnetoovum chiemensis]